MAIPDQALEKREKIRPHKLSRLISSAVMLIASETSPPW
jgi:hypothetical protein